MDFFKRLLGWNRTPQPETPEHEDAANITEKAKYIGKIIDGETRKLFTRHRRILLKEPLTYIVYAVWGAKQDGELTGYQKRINGEVIPILDNVMSTLDLPTIAVQDRYAIEWLVRSTIISKITFMIELFKNSLATEMSHQEEQKSKLEVISPSFEEWIRNLKVTDNDAHQRRFIIGNDQLPDESDDT